MYLLWVSSHVRHSGPPSSVGMFSLRIQIYCLYARHTVNSGIDPASHWVRPVFGLGMLRLSNPRSLYTLWNSASLNVTHIWDLLSFSDTRLWKNMYRKYWTRLLEPVRSKWISIATESIKNFPLGSGYKWGWILKLWRCVDWLRDISISEEPATLIFRTYFYPEERSSRLLRNFDIYLPNYMAPRHQKSNPKTNYFPLRDRPTYDSFSSRTALLPPTGNVLFCTNSRAIHWVRYNTLAVQTYKGADTCLA
jgi:hypothetical protein